MRYAALAPLLLVAAGAAQDDTAAARPARLLTRWARDVDPTDPLPEHPRPQLVRPTWTSLNGRWDLALVPRSAPAPATFTQRIVVPFAIESALSGVAEAVAPEQEAIYHRQFAIAEPVATSERLLLHFGAVDWWCEVAVNGRIVGTHAGGYDAFSFDVTGVVRRDAVNDLVVRVWDPTDTGTQPLGKQTLRPRGIWYTAVTGIWGSVWLEGVPHRHLRDVRFVTDRERGTLLPVVDGPDVDALRLTVHPADHPERTVFAADSVAALRADPTPAPFPEPRPWTPETPFLHRLVVRLSDGDRVVDEVATYCAFRDVAVRPDAAGIPRICLNGEPRFQIGLLDQGFWPDGLYTAPTDIALRHDLEITKTLGYDTIRKHVKVEPARWYHHCDTLGLLVWQDMPSGGPHIGGADADAARDAQEVRQFETELSRLVAARSFHPCIIGWVVFNEGWGQHETARYAELVHRLDPTRLVDAASGWTDRGVGDVFDVHRYPGPGMPPLETHRAAFLGEFGGLGLAVDHHLWRDRANWGYRSFADASALNDAYVALIEQLPAMAARGLCGAIYTQTTDVEIEVNGVMTYDREIVKLDAGRVAAAHALVHGPLPTLTTLLPTAEEDPDARWRYTTTAPAAGWTRPGYDDAGWASGPAGFGTPDTPGTTVRTRWDTADIWLRREIELPADTPPEGLYLLIHHDEDADLHVDGAPLLRLPGFTTGYVLVPLDPAQAGRLLGGRRTLAVHCRQTGGGQYLDLGLLRLCH
ncbi:MAG: hypothetical protein IPM29_12190 [Planctomycetes bacterium]|nr:hypothetical protein [Planctomycetota bacterium]